MIDKTTVGITAEPAEVEAVLHNLCGYHLAERDPVFRYTVLTREQVLYDGLVAAIKRERGRALAELVTSGTSMTHAAKMTNLTSRQQVQRLIAIAKAAEAAAAELEAAGDEISERLAAATEFENRLAAVEATLDEVVSGIAPPPSEPEADAEPLLAPDPQPSLDVDSSVLIEPAPVVSYEPVRTYEPVGGYGSGAYASIPQFEAAGGLEAAPLLEAVAPQPLAAPAPPIVPVPWTGDDPVDVAMVLGEATQALPALVISPVQESQPTEETRWWRRNRDSGAA